AGTAVTCAAARGSTRGLDEAQPAVPAAVDHRRAAGLGVGEEIEVVAEQLHLQRGLFGVHRLHVELLRLHDDLRRVFRTEHTVAVLVERFAGLGGRPSGTRPRAVATADTARVQAAHLLLDLLERAVERERVLRGRSGAL